MDSANLLGMLVSNLIGGAIGLAVARSFHRRAVRERDRWFTIIARFLEQFARAALPEGHPVRVEFSRDDKGRIRNAKVVVSVGQAVDLDRAEE